MMSRDGLAQRQSSPRLNGFDYSGCYAYSVTCCTNQKRPHFRQTEVVDETLRILAQVSGDHGFGIYAYCFMPDHLHILAVGEEWSSLPRFVRLFKQKSGFAFRRKCGLLLWQRSYYDHVLRKEELLRDVALYILGNPVRKGLVEEYAMYPFSGSLLFNVESNAEWL